MALRWALTHHQQHVSFSELFEKLEGTPLHIAWIRKAPCTSLYRLTVRDFYSRTRSVFICDKCSSSDKLCQVTNFVGNPHFFYITATSVLFHASLFNSPPSPLSKIREGERAISVCVIRSISRAGWVTAGGCEASWLFRGSDIRILTIDRLANDVFPAWNMRR